MKDVTRREGGREADTQQEIGGGRVRGGKPVVSPREFACRAEQTALPRSLLRHSRAAGIKQDYPDADRREGALQPARSRLLHLAGAPPGSLIDSTQLLRFGSPSSREAARRRGAESTRTQRSLAASNSPELLD